MVDISIYKHSLELAMLDLNQSQSEEDIKSIVSNRYNSLPYLRRRVSPQTIILRFGPLRTASQNHGEILALTFKQMLLALAEKSTREGQVDFNIIFHILDLSLEASLQGMTK
jgi:hypothetical protein